MTKILFALIGLSVVMAATPGGAQLASSYPVDVRPSDRVSVAAARARATNGGNVERETIHVREIYGANRGQSIECNAGTVDLPATRGAFPPPRRVTGVYDTVTNICIGR